MISVCCCLTVTMEVDSMQEPSQSSAVSEVVTELGQIYFTIHFHVCEQFLQFIFT